MRAFLALLRIDLRLAFRDKGVIFFNYLFPLMFFFAFSEFMGGATSASAMAQIVTMVLAIGVLGNGLWGAGMRLVQEREANILRRYKVTPISPVPILLASMITGWLIYLPVVAITLGLANRMYRMPLPPEWLSLLGVITAGLFAFRSLGLIIASVVNSMQESAIAIQLLYMPMMFLSGMTIPLTLLPQWAQIVNGFLPASYLVSGMQGVFLKHETLMQNAPAVGALLATAVFGVFIAVQLFRWEKGEKLSGKAKLWVLLVLSPFVLMGAWQGYTHEHLDKAQMLWREQMRGGQVLIRGARVFTGDGAVLEMASVLVDAGKITAIYPGNGPDEKDLKADIVEGSGKTLLPGLIDTHVHLGSPGGFFADPKDYQSDFIDRELAAYLYSGVTTVRSAGDWQSKVFAARDRMTKGRKLGAELFACGPMFTADDGHGAEYINYMPEMMRDEARRQLVRTPKTIAEAKAQVADLKRDGGDCVKAILESGYAGHLFERLDSAVFRAIVEEAKTQKMIVIVHTGSAQDIAQAVALPVSVIEHGSFSDDVPDALFAEMAKRGIAYDPTLSVVRAFTSDSAQKQALLDRPLLKLVAPTKMIETTIAKLGEFKDTLPADVRGKLYGRGTANLLRAAKAGVMLVAGSDAGNPLVIHGPTVQQELRLWTEAGIPAKAALTAATFNAAKALGAGARIGRIAKGYDANLLLVDGNPLAEIGALERISMVMIRGERVRRTTKLFEQK